jgi:FSR family fosmidomycin resistance protein-like MFS transporter
MARWTLAGGIGAAAGPLLLAMGVPWRTLFLAYAGLAGLAVLALRDRPFGAPDDDGDAAAGLLEALRRPDVLRWLLLLELQDLGSDTLLGFLALSLVESTGASQPGAALAVFGFTGAGVVGNIVLVRVLHRIDGLSWLRITAAGVAVLFPAFQLLPGLLPKALAVSAIGFLVSGWYPISQARLYDALPGRSGTAAAAATTAGALGIALPAAIGLLAGQVGLAAALWLVLVAPLALLLGLPRR